MKEKDMDMDEEWENFKQILTVSAKEACGEVIRKDEKVRTSWWTKEVREAIKEKKVYYKMFLRKKQQNH